MLEEVGMKRIKLIPKNAYLGIIVLFVQSLSIHSDTISLKNGKILNNVKSIIEKSSVKVKYENGKIENIPKSDIKSLKVLSVKGSEFTPRPEEDEINPWGNFGLGLIPGYSGLYRTEDTKTAISFSVFIMLKHT